MSIASQVLNAVDRMQKDDAEGALHDICSAIDATAQKEYGGSGRSAYKRFIADNLAMVTMLAFAGAPTIHGLRLAYTHPKLKASPDGTYSIEDIFYHVVRCGLYHSAGIPSDIIFEWPKVIRVDQGKLVLPMAMINALILAVVLSPTNAGLLMAEERLASIPFRINRLWGRKEDLMKLIASLS